MEHGRIEWRYFLYDHIQNGGDTGVSCANVQIYFIIVGKISLLKFTSYRLNNE